MAVTQQQALDLRLGDIIDALANQLEERYTPEEIQEQINATSADLQEVLRKNDFCQGSDVLTMATMVFGFVKEATIRG